jgi:general secretion pathway protein C
MFARLSAFVIWSLVGATAVFWLLRLAASSAPVPPFAVAVGNSVPVRGDLARLFGAPQRATATAQAAPEAPSRFKLVGVMAPRDRAAQAEPGHGVALIAVDGKPPKPFTVGSYLDSDLVLQSVGLRTASLGPADGKRSVLLELPALPPPHSGVLPPIGGAAAVPATPLRTMAAPVPAVTPGPPPNLGVPQPPPLPSAQPTPGTAPAGMPVPGGMATQ